MTITKKDFKEQCNFQVFTGRGIRINAIYFDYKSDDFGRGYKYAAASGTENYTKAELLNEFYDWVIKGVHMNYYVYSRFAQYDKQRFKLSLSFNHNIWN